MLRRPQHYQSRRAPEPEPEGNFYPSSERSDDPHLHLARKIIAIGGKSLLIPVINPIPGREATITPTERKEKARKLIQHSTEKEARRAMFEIIHQFPVVTVTRGARLFRGHAPHIPGTEERQTESTGGRKWGHWWAPNRAFALADFASKFHPPAPYTQTLTEVVLRRDAKFLILAGFGKSWEVDEELQDEDPIEQSFFQEGESYDRWPIMKELQCTQELSEKIAKLFLRMTGKRLLGRVTDIGLAHYLREAMNEVDGYIGIDCDAPFQGDTTEVIIFTPSLLLQEVVY